MSKSKGVGQGKGGGKPPHDPTNEQRTVVTVLTANGVDQANVARELHISEPTLRKHYRDELDHGFERVKAQIGANVVRKALKGDNACMFYWEKTRAGYSETTKLEHAGKGRTALIAPTLVINFVDPPAEGEPPLADDD